MAGLMPPIHESMITTKSFHTRLVSANSLLERGFKEWVIQPGMLFGSDRKWWGDGGARTTAHEGWDLCSFRTHESRMRRIQAGTEIPVVFQGTVVQVCHDFLGQSIFVRHDGLRSANAHLFTIYGHTKPFPLIRPSVRVAEGDIIATIADSALNRAPIPSHLHISVAWISDVVLPEGLHWEAIGHRPGVTLVDPLSLLDLPYSLIIP